GLKGDVAPGVPLSASLHPATMAASRNAGIQNVLKFELRISFSSSHTCKAIHVEPRYRNISTYEYVVCAKLHTAGKNHRISECLLLVSFRSGRLVKLEAGAESSCKYGASIRK